LAINEGVLRIREKKVNACEPSMANKKFFSKIGWQVVPATKMKKGNFSLEDWIDVAWQDMKHFYITNVRQMLEPNNFVNINDTSKLQLMFRLQ